MKMHTKFKSFAFLLYIIVVLSACQNMDKHPNQANDPEDLSGKDTYVNPVDGQTYHTEGEWKKHTPEEQRVNEGIVRTKQIILLTNENEIEPLISVEKLAEFIKTAEGIIYKEFDNSDEMGELLIQFTINDTGIPEVSISLKDSVDQDKASQVDKKLKAIRGYATKKDSVLFQLHIEINP